MASPQRPATLVPWSELKEGSSLLLAFVKIDRVGSTAEWTTLTPEAVLARRAQYVECLEQVAHDYDCALPLHLQGDGVMLFCRAPEDRLAAYACLVARAVRRQVYEQRNLPLRIAVHMGEVSWRADTGRLSSPEIDRCGHLEHAAPPNAVCITEDVYLELPEAEREAFSCLGVTRRDSLVAYAWPGMQVATPPSPDFTDSTETQLWESLRKYAEGPEISRVRYVGFRLTRKEPPSLHVRDVFVEPEVRVERSRAHPDHFALATARQKRPESAPWSGVCSDDPPMPVLRFREAMRLDRCVIVLGDPGSGKTTLLRWLAFMAAGGRGRIGRALGIRERLLPLPLSIGRLGDLRKALGGTLSAVDVIARYLGERSVGDTGEEIREALRRELERGACLLLFDGLDEVADETRFAVRSWLESFVAQYPRNRVVVTSRIVGCSGLV